MAEAGADAPVLFDATRAGVAMLRLNRPSTGNALNPDVVERLSDLLDELRGADGIRVVLIENAGPDFSVGPDSQWLRYSADYTHSDHLSDGRALAHMLNQIRHLPMPVIALVEGRAYGSGLGLVAAADMAMATANARFSLDEVVRGTIPAAVAPYIGESVGPGHLRRLAVLGEIIDAEEALRIGLVHRVVPALSDLASAAEEVVTRLFDAAPGAVAEAKALVSAVAYIELDERLEKDTAKRYADRRMSEEARAGLKASLAGEELPWRS